MGKFKPYLSYGCRLPSTLINGPKLYTAYDMN